jgi:signal transduction histidine kinase
MREPGPATARPTASGAPRDESDARERQSHVRHELRAPLAVIYPLLSLIRDGGAGPLTDQQREYLAVLDRNVTRLEALIGGALASGWTDCSPAAPDPEVVALGDVAEELVTLRQMEGAVEPVLLVDAGSTPSPRAWADPEDVRNILAGLVRNASTYTPCAGTVTIRTFSQQDRGTVSLQVRDTGPGIPPEELDEVFRFGYRGALARELKAPGLGAGLWVCRRLARRNGGDVTLASEAGAGATATVILPATGGGPA